MHPFDSDIASSPPGLAARVALRVRRNAPLGLLDLGVIVFAYLAPLVLRFNGAVPANYWSNFRSFLPLVVLIHLSANYLFGLYGQMWRYASVQEARRVVLATALAAVLVIGADLMSGGPVSALPLSVVLLGAVLCLMGFGAIRFQSRLFGLRRRTHMVDRTRVLLLGAGDAGSMILKDMLTNPHLGLDPAGIVDDDPRKLGLSLHGVRILGPRSAIPSLVRRLRIDQVLLAIPSATGEVIREVAALCEECDVPLRVLPSVRETLGSRITARDIRDLRIEDLLGRQQVETNLEAVADLLRGRRVMITGAGGSIGSEIARQVAPFMPSTLILLDHDESHLHDTVASLDPGSEVQSVLADVREGHQVLELFMARRPEVVFHAAAHKHVPILETHPREALLTNVIGTASVADAAAVAGVDRLVLISTDKAVRPASVMGCSKWFAEQIVRSFQPIGSVFCAVRFGNVVGSRGSVIPTFLRQIQRGGPVTVTDPSMTRYFMSVEEAVQLVLQAATLATGGEVFTLDMGEPVRIIDLARRLIHLSGRVPNRDVDVIVIGPRPGEKVVEELMGPGEQFVPSAHPGIAVSWPAAYERPLLKAALRQLEALAEVGPPEALAAMMRDFVGEQLEQPMSVGSAG
jgi:FlaA1/EpsC-like NDP-sugar epimerase